MSTDTWLTYLVVAAVITVITVAWLLVRRTRVRPNGDDGGPTHMLAPGWQFYSKPTTLDPPGTVFRIDSNRRRYTVDTLQVPVQVGAEAFGQHQDRVTASMGMLARFFGLEGLNARIGAGKTEQIVFEMGDAAREVVEDADLEPVLEPFKKALQYRVDNRYFVVRECRKAKEITYYLNRSQVDDLGGEATLADTLGIEGTLFTSNRRDGYILKQKFDRPLRVMFLPEELKPVSAGLAAEGPELGLVPVREVLEWEEG